MIGSATGQCLFRWPSHRATYCRSWCRKGTRRGGSIHPDSHQQVYTSQGTHLRVRDVLTMCCTHRKAAIWRCMYASQGAQRRGRQLDCRRRHAELRELFSQAAPDRIHVRPVLDPSCSRNPPNRWLAQLAIPSARKLCHARRRKPWPLAMLST